MRKSVFAVAVFCFATTACSQSFEDSTSAAEADTEADASQAEKPARNSTEKPVRIGEGGPRFDACQTIGRVMRSKLDVQVAPFNSAAVKDSINSGQSVYICTRSHDQQWFGIVYAEASPVAAVEEGNELAAPPAMGLGDCGVSSPVRSKRNYDGPCKSGWVESNFIKLIAG